LLIFNANTLKQTSLITPDMLSIANLSTNEYFTATMVTFHPHEDFLAISGQGNSAGGNGIFDIESNSMTSIKTDVGRGIKWNSTGEKFAISSPGDGHLRIWSKEGSLLHEVPRFKEAKGLTGLAWKPSDETIVSIGGSITLHQSDESPIR
jgi:WD40 repeat protein